MFAPERILSQEYVIMKSILRLTAMLLPGGGLAAGTHAETPPTPQLDVQGLIQEATLSFLTIEGMENDN